MNAINESAVFSNERTENVWDKLLGKAGVTVGLALLATSVFAQAHEPREDDGNGTVAAKKVALVSAAKLRHGRSPVTVFIDGPTGLVYVFTADGWKFVGNHVTEQF